MTPCTHPDNWPCSGVESTCNSQAAFDAYVMLTEGKARVLLFDLPDDEVPYGWTGRRETFVVDDGDA